MLRFIQGVESDLSYIPNGKCELPAVKAQHSKDPHVQIWMHPNHTNLLSIVEKFNGDWFLVSMGILANETWSA